MEELEEALSDKGLTVSSVPEKGRCLFTARDFSPGFTSIQIRVSHKLHISKVYSADFFFFFFFDNYRGSDYIGRAICFSSQ